MSDMIFVLDVDGVMTNGGMYYNKEQKLLKMFGPDDHDAIKDIMKHMPVRFITADKRGFDIVSKRIEDEMHCELDLVPHRPQERWDWIKARYPNKQIIFMGDGIYDWYCLRESSFGITTVDALDHVKAHADYVTKRAGGNRAAAEACLEVMKNFSLNWDMGIV